MYAAVIKRIVCHCCYQVAFQEINILFNRAHLVNCNLFLTESLYRKNYFSKTIKGLLNLTNIHRTIFSGQTYVQKWFLDYGHFYGRIWPFLTLMAIFTHQTAGIIAIIWPTVAHGGEGDSHQKESIGAMKTTDAAWKVWDASLAITISGHHFEGFLLWKILLWPFIDILVQYLHLFMEISYQKIKRISEQATNNKK